MAITAKSAAKKWVSKSEIDYLTYFVTAWIAFNAWYAVKYRREGGDRSRIEKIATNNSDPICKGIRNHLEGNTSENQDFQIHLGNLHEELENLRLKCSSLGASTYLSFYTILTEGTAIQTAPSGSKAPDNFYQCASHKFVRDPSKVLYEAHVTAKALICILYQLRNQLFHGELNPKADVQNVYKHAYFILKHLNQCIVSK